MYQNMFNVAQEIALKKRESGQISPNDTVCVICAASKKVYIGVNHPEAHNGMMVNIHAEVDALQQMRASGDNIAEHLLLIGTASLQPLLPCSGCIGLILSMDPENTKCQVVLPDRMIPIVQIGQVNGSAPFGGSVYGAPQGSMYGAPQGSMYGAPQGSMYGAPQGSMYGAPQGSMYGAPQGSMYGAPQGSVYTGASPQPSAYSGAPSGSLYASAPLPGSVSSSSPGGSLYASAPLPGSAPGISTPYGGSQPRPRKSGNSMLKNKVGNLVNAGKEIGQDEKEESAFMKKLFKK